MIRAAAVCLISLCLLSCGLEAFLYIDYIPPSDYKDTTETSVRLPSGSAEGYSAYFESFVIFYRIYTSDLQISGRIETDPATPGNRNAINPRLNIDYNALYPLTDYTSTTVNTANLENTFTNRGYYRLELEGAKIKEVLSGGALGKEMVINFSPVTGDKPTLTLRDTGSVSGPYVLQRDERLNLAVPDRHFLNDSDLYRIENIVTPSQTSSMINPDVFSNVTVAPDITYTYASMYIAAEGRDFTTTIYSQPTFLGIFQLANAN